MNRTFFDALNTDFSLLEEGPAFLPKNDFQADA